MEDKDRDMIQVYCSSKGRGDQIWGRLKIAFAC